jgi:hypothetical protein
MSLLRLLVIEFLQAFCLGFMSGLQFLWGLEVGVHEFFFVNLLDFTNGCNFW